MWTYGKGINMKSIFNFDNMLTTKLITFVYWLLLIAVWTSAGAKLFSGYSFDGILLLIGGSIGIRILCETMVVLFKINDNLQKIVNEQDR
jgi:hypothetical protein